MSIQLFIFIIKKCLQLYIGVNILTSKLKSIHKRRYVYIVTSRLQNEGIKNPTILRFYERRVGRVDLRRKGSNLRIADPKPAALPLGDFSIKTNSNIDYTSSSDTAYHTCSVLSNFCYLPLLISLRYPRDLMNEVLSWE